jgi:hypothetical protein
MLARFDIVLVAFAFTDGLNVMPRPAMVIYLSEPQIRMICLLSSAQRLQGQPTAMRSLSEQTTRQSIRAV